MQILRSYLYLLLAAVSATFLNASLYAQTVASAPVAQAVTAIPPAPAEAYGALPEVRAARLSPSGRKLALIMPVHEHDALVIWDLDGKEKTHVLQTGEAEPQWFVWKTEQRLIASLRYYSVRGRPTSDTRLVAVDADGTHMKDLIQDGLFGVFVPQTQDSIVGFLRSSDPDHILIELPATERKNQMHAVQSTSLTQYGNHENEYKYPEVVQVDINNGHLETLVRQRANVVGWQADADGKIRFSESLQDQLKSYQVLASDGSWRTIQSFTVNSGRIFVPLDFVGGNPKRLYVLSNHEGGPSALYEFDVDSNTFVRTIASNPLTVIEPIEQDRRLLGYRRFFNTPAIYLDPALAAEAKAIDKAIPDARNTIVDHSSDGKRVLVEVIKGNEPRAYWLLDRSTGKAVISQVAQTYPHLLPAQIAASRLITYQARDGLTIHALLTLPPGYRGNNGASPLPFVVLPHGGPTAHDEPAFNYMVQFIASRGYGVLQPQFRGSTGYGAAFEAAGHQQWGLAMQDDVTDATLWLIQQKLADPTRIAIVGASYGGYAALMGAVKEPNLYRCAVAIAPVTDLTLMLESNWQTLFNDINQPRIGTNPAILKKTSPASNADAIRIPLLLVHGRKDFTVPVEQTERMVEVLKKAGKPFDVLYLEQADHYLSHGEDRLQTLKAIEKFLGENLAAH